MKIFNWMRKRLSDDKDAGNTVEKHDDENSHINNDENDNYNKCLLNDHQINDHWSGSHLLSIGTFGFDPLKHYSNPTQQCPNHHYSVLDKENEVVKMEKEKDEIKESYDDQLGQGAQAESKNLPIVAIRPHVIDDHHFCEDQTAALINNTKMDNDDEIKEEYADENIMPTIMEKERTTLADLFNAESAGTLTEKQLSLLLLLPPPPPPQYRVMMMKEVMPLRELMNKIDANDLKKKKLSTKSVKKISQPIQKMVKKMLKRKIYPEVVEIGKMRANNNASLLQTSGINSELGA